MREKSNAYEFIELAWRFDGTNSWSRLNDLMYKVVILAISGNMEFAEDDFITISSKMRGGYWYHVNSNGKGMGELFYARAIEYRNISAIKAFEKYAGIKPFIIKGNRMYRSHKTSLIDNEFRYRVTGFSENNRLCLVAYKRMDVKEKGKKKLFNFTNKEWLVFRKTVKLF